MAKGILTLQSAGNDGPVSGSVASVAPWIFTVAASSTDRRIIDKVVLGNGKTLVVCILDSILLINYLIQSYTDSHTHITTSISTHICIYAFMHACICICTETSVWVFLTTRFVKTGEFC